MSRSLPLAGLTVVSVEHAVAAPLASRHLADWGARVIKVERPKYGDFARFYDNTVNGLSSHFVWVNRGKESLTLDIRTSKGRMLFDKLIETADVFIHNLSPRAADQLNLSFDALRAVQPRIVMCQISGYGHSGPLRSRKAYDLLIQAGVGLVNITGTPEAPCKVGIPVADIAAGMYAFTNVLLALLGRQQSNEGAFIDISMLEAAAEWMGYPFYYSYYGGAELQRFGLDHSSIAPYGRYLLAGDEYIFLAIQNEGEWRQFCRYVLFRPELSDDKRFVSNAQRLIHRSSLDEIIQGTLRTFDLQEATRRLETAKVAFSKIDDVRSLSTNPQLRARERWTEVRAGATSVLSLIPPGLEAAAFGGTKRVPALGEDTLPILRAIGISEPEIEQLRVSGVI